MLIICNDSRFQAFCNTILFNRFNCYNINILFILQNYIELIKVVYGSIVLIGDNTERKWSRSARGTCRLKGAWLPAHIYTCKGLRARAGDRRDSYSPRTAKNFSCEWKCLRNYPQRAYSEERTTRALQRALLQMPSAARMGEEEGMGFTFKLESSSSVGVEWIDILWVNWCIHFNNGGTAEASSGQNKRSAGVTVTGCCMRCRCTGRLVRGDGDADGLETSHISASHPALVVSR